MDKIKIWLMALKMRFIMPPTSSCLSILLFVIIITSILNICNDCNFISLNLSDIFAQKPQNTPPGTELVKITSHRTNQSVATGELTIYGISSDTSIKDCTVYLDWNNLKPYQIAIPKTVGINNDYSTWSFTYKQNYHLIVAGTNELTAKISCYNPITNQTINKWNSIIVTGVNPALIAEQNISSNASTPKVQQNISSNASTPKVQQNISSNASTPKVQQNISSNASTLDNLGTVLNYNVSRVRVDGTERDDTISGLVESSLVVGKGGNDIIKAGRGDDLIQGGTGNDKINGENGNDILFGGLGDDILTGGKGADVFYCGVGQDSIADYNSTEGDMRSSDCETVH